MFFKGTDDQSFIKNEWQILFTLVTGYFHLRSLSVWIWEKKNWSKQLQICLMTVKALKKTELSKPHGLIYFVTNHKSG